MNGVLYLPLDEFARGDPPNLDLAADWLELSAAFSSGGLAFAAHLADALELSADAETSDIAEDEISDIAENAANGAIDRMAERRQALDKAYPFDIGADGDTAAYRGANPPNNGQAAYLLSLVLSNLRAVSPLLGCSSSHPTDVETREMRRCFQYFATAALAAEVGGPAWSFGFPRPGGSGFMEKLSEIWAGIGDGAVKANPSAPTRPKDDAVDVFACRKRSDRLPGFLFAAAQVATGKTWRDKSIRDRVRKVFPMRWFLPPPVTEILPYHIVPFARPDDIFPDDVLLLGNVLHRTRVPRRVLEANDLVANGVAIEAFDRLEEGAGEMQRYLDRVRRPGKPEFPA